jgi:NAD(P)H-dependent FMN reductase
MKKLLFLAGSARKDSLNKQLAREAFSIATDLSAIATYIDLKDFPMPIYDGDLETESGLPENAKKLKNLFCEHNGFFISSPEYNSSVPALLKNSLDWISRPSSPGESSLIAFKGKVCTLAAASPGGLGGLRGLVTLRMMLGNIGVFVTPTQIAVPFADNAFNSDGHLKDTKQKEGLTSVVREFIDITNKM